MELSERQEAQLRLMNELFAVCEMHGVQIWLFGGWGIDALLGSVTRQHRDIDALVFAESKEDLRAALAEMGAKVYNNGTGWYCEKDKVGMDVGFLHTHSDGTVVSDVDPSGPEVYPWPPDSFPGECNGELAGVVCRAISWEGQFIAKAGYMNAFPDSTLREKDEADLRVIMDHIPGRRCAELERNVLPGIPRETTVG